MDKSHPTVGNGRDIVMPEVFNETALQPFLVSTDLFTEPPSYVRASSIVDDIDNLAFLLGWDLTISTLMQPVVSRRRVSLVVRVRKVGNHNFLLCKHSSEDVGRDAGEELSRRFSANLSSRLSKYLTTLKILERGWLHVAGFPGRLVPGLTTPSANPAFQI